VRRSVFAVLAALVLVPAAGAWTRLTPNSLPNTVRPAVALSGSTELVAYDDGASTLRILSRPGGTKTIFSGWPGVFQPALAAGQGGTVVLVVPAQNKDASLDGALISTSSNGGKTFAALTQTGSKDLADVTSVALRSDGTPLFVQQGTGFTTITQGTAGETSTNIFQPCCGYAATLAVDSNGLAQIAFWSNATGKSGYLYGRLNASGALAGGLRNVSGGAETLSVDTRVPLVADGKGNTFMAWAPGYPESSAFRVTAFRSGSLVRTTTVAPGPFPQPDPHMALAVDSSDRLWAVWTKSGSVYAARSRTSGAHFGAAVRVASPGNGSVYQLAALALADGSVDVYANAGGSPKNGLWAQVLLPGLTVSVANDTVRVLDDGFPVSGAKVTGGGKSSTTDTKGEAPLTGIAAGATLAVTKAGYAPAAAKA
jgi:hypothetical protein